MIITKNMNNPQVEDDKNSMAIISQFYSPSVFTAPTGIVQAAGEPPSNPKRRRQRKRNSNRDGGGFSALKKRKLTGQQAELLEMHFGNEHKLESDRKDKIASELGLDPRQVAVWFQNRRARDKTKKIEESYANLKAAHENAAIDNTRLEAEVATLKEKLSVAENEIKKMEEVIEGIARLNNNNNNPSPMSSLPMDMDSYGGDSPPFALDPLFAGHHLGWSTDNNNEDFCYLLQQNYISAADWLLLHMN